MTTSEHDGRTFPVCGQCNMPLGDIADETRCAKCAASDGRDDLARAIEALELLREHVGQIWSLAAQPARRAVERAAELDRENHALRTENFRLRHAVERDAAALGVHLEDLRAYIKRRARTSMGRGKAREFRFAEALLRVLEEGTPR
jgi:hypothetical protein